MSQLRNLSLSFLETGNLMQPEAHTTQGHRESRPQGGGTADEEGVVGARPASGREDREAAVGGAAGGTSSDSGSVKADRGRRGGGSG